MVEDKLSENCEVEKVQGREEITVEELGKSGFIAGGREGGKGHGEGDQGAGGLGCGGQGGGGLGNGGGKDGKSEVSALGREMEAALASGITTDNVSNYSALPSHPSKRTIKF